MEGIVKWFDAKKGYGFIQSPELVDDNDEQRDIFVHFTKILMDGFKKVEEGEVVDFELTWGEDDRPQAANVERRGAPSTQG